MLENRLKEYSKTNMYPFHMPGHKRIPLDDWNPYQTDITEIDGFDNLHHAKEVLLESQQRAARLYGSKECFYLVNGSTCGILAAIHAVLNRNGRILIGRNSHKSVYNAISLLELDSHYVYPNLTEDGIQGRIKASDIEEMLEKKPAIGAVLITSPTYDGVVSDISAIAEVVHKRNIPLIVDAAHGAHLGFSKGFPENPIKLGADIVIESVHKTLPAFTQTALLHVCSDRVSVEKIKKYLSIFETSSPSYVLMAGIDRCINYLQEHGSKVFARFEKNLEKFYERAKNLQNLKVLHEDDPSKILIFSNNINVRGKQIYDILRDEFHLQMEMASGQYVLAMSSIMDTEEGFERLIIALEQMDKNEILRNSKIDVGVVKPQAYFELPQMLPIYQAESSVKKEVVSLEEAIGQVAGEYLYLYPPGIPIAAPGEYITEELIRYIIDCQQAGLTVEGFVDKNRICIVKLF